MLFIDDPKINTTRLHRILRNLCYHAPTRDWVIKSLLSILEKSNDKQILGDTTNHGLQNEMPPAKIQRKSTNKFSSDISKTESGKSGSSGATTTSPSWLNISMDAALGFRANVFQVCRVSTGKKNTSNGNTSTIAIHPGASSVVCR